MEASKLKDILEQHRVWLDTNGKLGERAYLADANLTDAKLTDANLTDANLMYANLTNANLMYANLTGANLKDANLEGSIGLPDISWVIPGCLVQLNKLKYCGFYSGKERKHDNFIQDSLGFFIQDNLEEKTFDILAGDRIIRNIPDWLKYTGLKKIT
jgi:hypothetical protein